MRRLLLTLALLMAAPWASAQPAVKILNLTAQWCPNCHILNPRLAEALTDFSEDEATRIDLDMTDARGAARPARLAELATTAEQHKAGPVWAAYGGGTGLAALIASDNGELLSCLTPAKSVQDMRIQIRHAVILAQKGRPGARMPDGVDCPRAFN